LLAVAAMTLVVAMAGSAGSGPTPDVLAAVDHDAFHRGFRAAMMVAGIFAALGGAVIGIALRPSSRG